MGSVHLLGDSGAGPVAMAIASATVVARSEARANALQKLIKTFFDGSTVAAVNALLGMNKQELSDAEIAELKAAIEKAKKQ